MSSQNPFDVAIFGAGIVGLATGYRLQQSDPSLRIVVLEKEPRVAEHQTGHNSGVLHSGIYYKPGSLKAINCREGKLAMQEFCQQHAIPYELCGKVIVAIDESELESLQKIYERGQQNGVQCEVIDAERLRELEPHAAGIRAIHVPEAGIVDYRAVCEKLEELLKQAGAQFHFNAAVSRIEEAGSISRVEAGSEQIEARLLINCCGLHCDRVGRIGGDRPSMRIVPFRGEYFELRPERQHLCRNLIYPVPDPKFPFLGVHFTRMIGGGVECGPNAVLAFAREGYRRTHFNLRDLWDSLTYPGFARMSLRHWKMGAGEMWRSFSKAAFVRALQRLMPEIQAEDLLEAPAGVRAQAVQADGNLVDDFLVSDSSNMINVYNAPSPAATASLNIGKLLAERALPRVQTQQAG